MSDEAPIFEHDGVWCCSRKSQCKWQGFALYKGLGWGTPDAPQREWKEAHNKWCGGVLVQLLPPYSSKWGGLV